MTINRITSKTDYQYLEIIFDKIKRGIGLTVLERGDLKRLSEQTPSLVARAWSFVSSPKDQNSVEEIDRLASRILNKEVQVSAVLSETEQTLQSCRNPSVRETVSLAKLVDACFSREDLFLIKLSRFRTENGRDPERSEIIELVASIPRDIQSAGLVVAHLKYDHIFLNEERTLEIKYDAEGNLQITDGPIAPLDTRYRQILTKEQLGEISDLYERLSKGTPFNNLGQMLEFIKFYKGRKKDNPLLTLKPALEMYHPHLPDIFDKYRSGTCILLASKLCDELAKRGIQGQILSTSSLNPWTALPIPGKEVELKWVEMSKRLSRVDHADAVCLFRNDKGEGLLRFRCSFENNDLIKYYRTTPADSALSSLQFEIGESELPNRVIDSSEIGKTRLIGRHKCLIKKDEMILGIDFLRGNIYFKPTPGHESSQGLPLNDQGKVSINIADVANPEGKGIYFVNGHSVEMLHQDALRLVLEKARCEVYLPADTEENLIALAECASLMFEDFFLEPLPLIRQKYTELAAIHQKLAYLKEHQIRADELFVAYDDILRAICFNEPDAAQKIDVLKAKLEALLPK